MFTYTLAHDVRATVTSTSVHLSLPTPEPGDHWVITQMDDNDLVLTLHHDPEAALSAQIAHAGTIRKGVSDDTWDDDERDYERSVQEHEARLDARED